MKRRVRRAILTYQTNPDGRNLAFKHFEKPVTARLEAKRRACATTGGSPGVVCLVENVETGEAHVFKPDPTKTFGWRELAPESAFIELITGKPTS